MDTVSLTLSLRTAIASLHKTLRKQMAQTTVYSMTELETIGLIARHTTILPTELASLTRITTQSMSQILKKIEGQGIITRTPSEEDRRKVYVSLTSQGKKLVKDAQYHKDQYLHELIDQTLTSKEKDILAKAMPVLTKLATAKQ